MQKTDKLISANALLEKVQFRIDTPGIIGSTVRDMVATTRRIIEEAPAALQWISVTEHLPEKKVDVLVYLSDGSMGVDFIDTDGNWFWDDGWNVGDARSVTHWMRLPEPPEKEAR